MSWLKKLIAWFRIPNGPYCSGCPYWRPNIAPIETGDRTIAYCKYLDQTDLDIIQERLDNNVKLTDLKTGEELKFTKEELIEMGFVSLLWDGCKMCEIKDN